MIREVKNWHGKEIELRIYERYNKFGCEATLRIEGQEFYGSTVSWHECGMCRFDTADAAIEAAITNIENRITLVASDDFIEKHRQFFDEQNKHHKVAKWLQNNIRS